MASTYHRLKPRIQPTLLSVVIPVYNEEKMIPILRKVMTHFVHAAPFPVQLLLVNDGSSDSSMDLLSQWADDSGWVKVIGLARNFGHQAAVTAGLDHSTGDAVVIMDADLQDPPEAILQMVEQYCLGFDVVVGRRLERQGENVFKKLSAWAFYRLMRILVHKDLPADVGDFRLISRRCLNALNSMRETHRFLRGMGAWVGFAQTEVVYVRKARAAGETKYPLHKMFTLAWNAALSFSPVPLRISFLLGLLLFIVGITQALNAVFRSLVGLPMVAGWASLMIVTCLVGGGILISIGVLGEYIARIFEEVKGRPLYFVSDTANLPRTEEDLSLTTDLIRIHQELR